MKNHQAYKCPNCGLGLERLDNVWKCASNHSFDVAKEGYVNLILANKKRSLISGDGKEMIAAREQFLKRGHYDFLVEFLINLGILQEHKFKKFLEIGCGSGYYLDKIAGQIKPDEVYGADVSKEAIKFCAKSLPDYSFAVSNSFNLDFQDKYFDLLLSVFSPFKHEEIERVLAENGWFILVRPNKEHLKELYAQVGIPQKDKIDLEFKNLELKESHNLVKKINFSKEDLALLIKMSPLNWKIDEEKKALENIKEITLDFKISVYQLSDQP
jgi:23S rRNA (guanine745-N1)-methyltransferase